MSRGQCPKSWIRPWMVCMHVSGGGGGMLGGGACWGGGHVGACPLVP